MPTAFKQILNTREHTTCTCLKSAGTNLCSWGLETYSMLPIIDTGYGKSLLFEGTAILAVEGKLPWSSKNQDDGRTKRLRWEQPEKLSHNCYHPSEGACQGPGKPQIIFILVLISSGSRLNFPLMGRCDHPRRFDALRHQHSKDNQSTRWVLGRVSVRTIGCTLLVQKLTFSVTALVHISWSCSFRLMKGIKQASFSVCVHTYIARCLIFREQWSLSSDASIQKFTASGSSDLSPPPLFSRDIATTVYALSNITTSCPDSQ